MTQASSLVLAISVMVGTLTGCATAEGRFGTVARYSPAVRGYVLTADDASDDPGPDEAAVVFVNPLSGDKVQCGEELERWLHPHLDDAVDDVDDETWELGTMITMSPLLYASAAHSPTLAATMLVTSLVYSAGMSEAGVELFDRGVALFERKRYVEAGLLLERAVVRAPELTRYSKALYYLGLVYGTSGRDDEARTALTRFVRSAAVRDVNAYRNAEGWLASLQADLDEACASREPVEIIW